MAPDNETTGPDANEVLTKTDGNTVTYDLDYLTTPEEIRELEAKERAHHQANMNASAPTEAEKAAQQAAAPPTPNQEQINAAQQDPDPDPDADPDANPETDLGDPGPDPPEHPRSPRRGASPAPPDDAAAGGTPSAGSPARCQCVNPGTAHFCSHCGSSTVLQACPDAVTTPSPEEPL